MEGHLLQREARAHDNQRRWLPATGARRARGRPIGHGLGAAAPLALALAIAIVAVYPALAVHGIVATRAGGDSPFLLQRTQQMAEVLAAREFPPRSMPDAAYGLGYPFWNYYAPLVYIVAGLLALASGAVVGAVKVAALAAYLLAAAGMYALALRTWDSRAAALLSSAAYTLAPYHLVNVYVRGDALAEVAAYAVLPWVLLAVDELTADRSTGRVVLLALAFGALLVSHNITAMLFVPLLVAFALWRCLRPRGAPVVPGGPPPGVASQQLVVPAGPFGQPAAWARRGLLITERRLWPLRRFDRSLRVVAVTAGLALGALLSLWYWGPALYERSAVQLGANLTGYFHYANHFRGLDIVGWRPLFDYGADRSGTCGPCRLGVLQLALAVFGLVAGLRAPRRRATTVFWMLVGLAAVFMVTPLSRIVWSAPFVGQFLAFAQFPWRWLSIASLALAMLSGAVGRLRLGGPFALVCAGVLALGSLGGVRAVPLVVSTVDKSDLLTYEVFSENIGTTVRQEYLPTAVVPRPWTGPEAISGTAGDPVAIDGFLESAARERREANTSSWAVIAAGDGGVASTIAFPTLWFPGAEAQIDDGPFRPSAAVEGSGWVKVSVPAGSHTVTLRLGRTTARAVAEGLSLLAWLLALALVLANRRLRLWRWIVAATVAFVLAAWLAREMPVGDRSNTGPITLDFTQAPYPHYNPDGIRYGQARLLSAAIGGTQPVNAEEGVVLNTRWQPAVPEWRVEVALVTPGAVNPALGAPDVRAATGQEMGEVVNLVIPVPQDAPTGMYFIRVRAMNDGQQVRPVDAGGRDVGDVYLGPVTIRGKDRFEAPSGEPVGTMGPLQLLAVQAIQQGNRMEVRTDWESTERMPLNYKTSVRLATAGGEVIAQRDAEPLYGFYPTTSWGVHSQLRDRRWLDLKAGTAAGSDYRVIVVVYDEASGRELGTGIASGVHVE